MTNFTRLMKDEDGAVAVEYGLIVTLISLAVAAGAFALGEGLDTLFTNVATCFDDGAGGTCPVNPYL